MARVLVTGASGYIGSVLVPMLQEQGDEAVGLDVGYFESCVLGPEPPAIDLIRRDVRDLSREDIPDVDAVIHLAALSNDALGHLDPAITHEVNTLSTLRTAELARERGVERFLFSSSCSLYGAGEGDTPLDESASMHPQTPYGRSKQDSEAGLTKLATDDFSPVYLRNATAYGFSPRLRGDLVVNELVARARVDGKVQLNSDGTAWRPLVHVEDICRAFLAALRAPREVVHDQAFNVGTTAENFTIREVAEMICEAVPGSQVTFGEGAGPDTRSYRVSFEKLANALPDAVPQWTLRQGIQQLVDAYDEYGITIEDLVRARYSRIAWLLRERDGGRLDATLHRVTEAAAS